jgi:hypothetical protein
MSKIVLDKGSTNFDPLVYNENFRKIENEFNDKVLYRDNPSGEPNEMQNDLDMNSNRVYNLPAPTAEHEAARLKDVQDAVSGASAANLISFNPYKDITSTNVQGAIQEVKDDVDSISLELDNLVIDDSRVVVQQPYVESIVRSQHDKNLELVSVKDFGAIGDGIADDTISIQFAVNSVGNKGGGSVYFPVGTYRITSNINITFSSVKLIGESRWATIIQQDTLNSKILNITGDYFKLEEMSFLYSGTPQTGATSIYCSGSFCSFKDFVIRNSHIGIEYTIGAAGKITDFDLLDYENIGLFVHSINDLFVSRFLFNAGTEARGAFGGIRLGEKVEAFICTDGDILLGNYSLTTTALNNILGVRPAYNNFTNVFFDSSALGVSLDKLVLTEFVGCWFSGGRAGGSPGCTINECDSLTFTNTRFFNNGGSGCAVTSSAKRTSFIGCSFESNSINSTNTHHGLLFSANTTDFLVTNCVAHNGLFPGVQGYGILINSGCSNFTITDNNLVGNGLGSIADSSGAASYKKISGNIGYRTVNSGGATIPASATSVVVNHGLSVVPRHQDIQLIRGTTNAGTIDLYVDSTTITGTSFTVRTAPAPSVGMTVFFKADCERT